MYFSSPTANITPAMTSVHMSRSDSRDSTSSMSNGFSYAQTTAYTALLSASPSSSWMTAHPLVRSDSNTSTTTSQTSCTSSPRTSIAMRRDSSNSSWLPSPYRSCQSSFGTEANSYLSDDDLLCPIDDLSLPVETIPSISPKKELTTEEQIALLREIQEKEASQHSAFAHATEPKRKVVRFASHGESSSRRPSTIKRRQTSTRRGLSHLNGPQ
ncbi:hypothetical protein LTR84_011276 [Exophiala bonariae]|uniref:Uncharacterized protein n=1 Tax=Exophiala bonariae TaxID=1690606 RepID=A0AAV9MSQ3_9EURO|nr:hypothetical protein LTR84_011276 [Exophiala bonariae]